MNLNKSFPLIFIAILSIYTSYVYANIYSSVTSVDIIGPNNQYRYNFSIDLWDEVGDMTPNPCYGGTICWIKINHLHGGNQTGGNKPPTNQAAMVINTYPTIKEVRDAYLQQYPLPITGAIEHSGLNPIDECVGLFFGGAEDNAFTDRLFPTSVCGMIPPPVGRCDLTPESVVLDHGVISENEISSSVASESLTVSCTGEGGKDVVIYSLEGTGGIDLSGGVISKLYIDGKAAVSGVTIRATEMGTTVILESKLTGIGVVSSGEHSGSTTLLMAIP
ncbi:MULTISPECIES: hypothetical protein [Serratia]|uniref:MrpH family fimbial adhesin n=1 Tax=Serratia TaxID=613 RepID=UPI00384D9837